MKICLRPQQTTNLATFGAFVALLLFLSSRTPMTFDDAFNANVALSLANGDSYATRYGDSITPFNPYISTGSFFISPYSIILRFFGPNHFGLQAYSLGVSLIFFSISVWFARIGRMLPFLLIAFSVVFLVHGKTDLIDPTIVTNLSSPLFGLWFQFLGNMAGSWALVAATLACAHGCSASNRRLGVIFGLSAFAVNAKMVHALPLMVATFMLLLTSALRSWRQVLCAIAGGGVGLRSDSWMAWFFLDAEQFLQYQNNAKAFFVKYQGLYSELLLSPRWDLFLTVIKTIPARFGPAVEYVGLPLLVAAGLATAISIGGSVNSEPTCSVRSIRRAQLAIVAAACAVLLWWCGMPQAPSRFLTVVPPLLVSAVAVGLGGLLETRPSIHPQVTRAIFLVILCFVGWTAVSYCRVSSRRSYALRLEQQNVASMVKELGGTDRRKRLCGEGWWYPHEISFLTGSPDTIPCSRGGRAWRSFQNISTPAPCIAHLLSQIANWYTPANFMISLIAG